MKILCRNEPAKEYNTHTHTQKNHLKNMYYKENKITLHLKNKALHNKVNLNRLCLILDGVCLRTSYLFYMFIMCFIMTNIKVS